MPLVAADSSLVRDRSGKGASRLHYVGVFNRDSGTFRTMDMAAFCAEAERVFSANGHTLDCHVVESGELVAELERAARKPGAEAILAGGGDGTISAAAAVAFRHGLPLAAVPAGTMNLFARSLGIPLSPLGALEALAGGTLRSIDIATANCRPFVLQYSVGIHARLVRIRENLKYRSRMGKILASLRAIATAIFRPPSFRAEIRTPRGVERRSASGINVSNNPLGEGHLPHADTLDGGVLGVYVLKPLSATALARLMLDVFRGKWRASPLVSEKEVEQVSLRFPRRKSSAHAVVDGELIALDDVVEIQIHPRALHVIVPVAPVA